MTTSSAQNTSGTVGQARYRIAILIDDMGDNLRTGEQALALPGAISYAFLPHTAHAQQLARAAHNAGRDVLLHAPMQSESHLNQMGPGALTLSMTEAELRQQFIANIAAIPYARGFNNHMGSVLTRDRERMHWLMQEARQRNLFFVDSRTTNQSIAASVAREHGLFTRGRDVFLDHDLNVEAIRVQFRQLLRIARERGSALAIGHPHASTLQVLREELGEGLRKLDGQNIDLVGVSALSAPLASGVSSSVASAGDSRVFSKELDEPDQPPAAQPSKLSAQYPAGVTVAKPALQPAPSKASSAKAKALAPSVLAVSPAHHCAPIKFDQQQLSWHQNLLASEQLAQWLACQRLVSNNKPANITHTTSASTPASSSARLADPQAGLP